MPHFTLAISPSGPLLNAYVGVSEPRRQALVKANQPIPPVVAIIALVDTGASCTCVDADILAPLLLTPTGQVPMHTPTTGAAPANISQYDVGLYIPGATARTQALIFNTIPIAALPDFRHLGFDALIGRDILRSCVLHYNGTEGVFTLAS